ncbi:hypothetical protein KKA33_02880 [Patescibacteria group bacterium]|nr:hypothetical protein [Patescibacteria group bacterium]
MSLSEDAINGLNTIGAYKKPFDPAYLASCRQLPGSEEFLVEREEDGPVPTVEGMQIILERIAADIIAKRKRKQLMAALEGGQADEASQKHGEAK